MLIFFWNIQIPAVITDPLPVTLQAIELMVPALYAVENVNINLETLETLAPSLYSVQEATGEFTPSTITYSSPTNTYNDGLYGGADQPMERIATLDSIDDMTPELYSFNK